MIRSCVRALLIISLASLIACGGARKKKDEPLPAKVHAQDIQADYYPLRVGNSWTYKVNTMGEQTEQTISIGGTEGKFFKLEGGAAGLIHRDGYGIRDQHRYLLKFPVELGGKWQSILAHDSIERYEITAVGEQVEVPAGTFKGCTVVSSKQSIDKDKALGNRVWFAPGVGIVRLQTSVHVAGQAPAPQVTLELLKYKVSPTEPPPVLKPEDKAP